jgi:hypothetical protein
MLNAAQAAFLREYIIEGGVPRNENDLPVFLVNPGEAAVFLPGFAYHGRGKPARYFQNFAPSGLYLGGAALTLLVPHGIVSIPDRRHGGNLGPAAQGWAKYREGYDLRAALLREAWEELTLFLLSGEGDNLYQPCIEIVATEILPKKRVESLRLDLDDVAVYGNISFYDCVINEPDRSFMYIGVWDLRDIENGHRLRVIWDDDFPGGRRPGTNPRVLDHETGEEIGRFEGLQGFLRNDMPLHPAMAVVAKRLGWSSNLLNVV